MSLLDGVESTFDAICILTILFIISIDFLIDYYCERVTMLNSEYSDNMNRKKGRGWEGAKGCGYLP